VVSRAFDIVGYGRIYRPDSTLRHDSVAVVRFGFAVAANHALRNANPCAGPDSPATAPPEPRPAGVRPLSHAICRIYFRQVVSGSSLTDCGSYRDAGRGGTRWCDHLQTRRRAAGLRQVEACTFIACGPAFAAAAHRADFQWLNATYWPANIRRVRRIVERHRCQVLHVHNHIFRTWPSTGPAAPHRRGADGTDPAHAGTTTPTVLPPPADAGRAQ